MNHLQQRKLKKYIIKQIRDERILKMYLLNLKWALIKKQKERRRRRTLRKLWKLKRLAMMKQGVLPLLVA